MGALTAGSVILIPFPFSDFYDPFNAKVNFTLTPVVPVIVKHQVAGGLTRVNNPAAKEAP